MDNGLITAMTGVMAAEGVPSWQVNGGVEGQILYRVAHIVAGCSNEMQRLKNEGESNDENCSSGATGGICFDRVQLGQ